MSFGVPLGQGQRDSLRDQVADTLTTTDPKGFPRYSQLGIIPVITAGLGRLPQVSYTVMPGSTCCDGILIFSRSTSPERKTRIRDRSRGSILVDEKGDDAHARSEAGASIPSLVPVADDVVDPGCGP